MTRWRILPAFIAFLALTPVSVRAADWASGWSAHGRGDLAAAIGEWFVAATEGDARAQYSLAGMLYRGEGTPRDLASAAEWYHIAAQQGYEPAQFELGRLYMRGEGVARDLVQAHLWLDLARGLDPRPTKVFRSRHSAEHLTLIEKVMLPSELAEAERLASEWRRSRRMALGSGAATR